MPALDRIAQALSDPIRLQIMDLLVAGRADGCCSPGNPDTPAAVCSCDILDVLDLAPSKLSYHLKELREAGLVLEQKRGRWVYYSLNQKTLNEFTRALQARYIYRDILPVDELLTTVLPDPGMDGP